MSAFEKPQIISHIQKSLNYTVFDCKWMPCSAKFVTMGNFARGTGVIQLYEIQQGDLKLLREIEKAKPIKCGTFGATSLQQRYLATGDFAGNLHIWNLEAPEVPVYSVKGHKEIINTIDGVGGLGIGEGAPEIVTGSRDGTVKVWDPRQKDDPVANMEPVQGENKRDCWTVAFGNAYNQEERVVCAGYDNGDIKLFDLRNMSLRWETNIKNGVCSLEFDRKDISMNKLVATSLEGKFHVFDMRTQHPTKGFASVSEKAHKSTVWQVRHLPQNREVFLTAGGAGSLHLWKYEYPIQRSKKDSEGVEMGVAGSVSLLQNVTLSTQPISSLDWSPDKRGPKNAHSGAFRSKSELSALEEASEMAETHGSFGDRSGSASPDPGPGLFSMHCPRKPLYTPVPWNQDTTSQASSQKLRSASITLIIMAGEGINEDYPVEIHEYLSTFENSIGAVDEMLKTMMSVSRNELLQKLDPLEQAKVDLVSAYTLNSMFWVYLATQGVNPKEHPVKQELERIRVYMNRVKEITDKKKAGKLDRGAASRFVKNALWEPKPKNAPKVANKGKSKN
ncbi:hypothetical protein AB1E18_008822 [Capra hircus]